MADIAVTGPSAHEVAMGVIGRLAGVGYPAQFTVLGDDPEGEVDWMIAFELEGDVFLEQCAVIRVANVDKQIGVVVKFLDRVTGNVLT
jgi:hypothetical protein